jgi:hypothetical protein
LRIIELKGSHPGEGKSFPGWLPEFPFWYQTPPYLPPEHLLPLFKKSPFPFHETVDTILTLGGREPPKFSF